LRRDRPRIRFARAGYRLHFKKVGRFWSVRIGLRYRALGVEAADSPLRFWIGSHADYDALIK
jgi:hypothetical protein